MNPTIKGIITGLVIILAFKGIHTFNMWLFNTFTHGQIKAGFYTIFVVVCVVLSRYFHHTK